MVFEAEARIILNAEDNASPEVKGAVDNINDAWRDYRNEQRAVERQTILSNSRLYETAGVLKSVGHIASQATHLYTAYNVQQIRIAQANKNVADAQRELNEAQLSGDPDAVALAQEHVNQALADQKQALQDAAFGWITMGTQAVGMIGSIIKEYPKVKKLVDELKILNSTPTFTGGGKIGGALPNTVPGTAGSATSGFMGKLKSFVGSPLGQVVLPATAFLTTYEFLTDTDLGKQVKQYNPFKLLGDSLFSLTHTSEETKAAIAARDAGMQGNYGLSNIITGTVAPTPTVNQTNNFYGTSPKEAATYISEQASQSAAFN